ncbi:hypothetical protein CE195_08605 [Sodalis-like symbiont of Philaenus spumarius]|nr:hypothetical protein CE195_08605 [Sodalis-like symbiont of Philaenus spumarius]
MQAAKYCVFAAEVRKIQNLSRLFYNITALGYNYQQALVYIAFCVCFAWEWASGIFLNLPAG